MASSEESGGSTGRAVLVAVVGQTALLTGSLFYFGYIRAQATFGYFGVDVSLLNFSATDYLLRSGPAVFLPTLAFSLIYVYFASARLIYPLIRDSTTEVGRRRLLLGAALVMVLLTIAVAALVLENLIVPESFLLIAGSSAASLLGFVLTTRPESDGLARSIIVPVFLVAAALFFLATALQAQEVGIATARDIEHGDSPRPAVELYSEKPLAVSDADGVSTTSLSDNQGKYKYKIVGLRLLISSGGQYFLLRSHPSQGPGDVVVVPAGQDVRVNVRKVSGS